MKRIISLLLAAFIVVSTISAGNVSAATTTSVYNSKKWQVRKAYAAKYKEYCDVFGFSKNSKEGISFAKLIDLDSNGIEEFLIGGFGLDYENFGFDVYTICVFDYQNGRAEFVGSMTSSERQDTGFGNLEIYPGKVKTLTAAYGYNDYYFEYANHKLSCVGSKLHPWTIGSGNDSYTYKRGRADSTYQRDVINGRNIGSLSTVSETEWNRYIKSLGTGKRYCFVYGKYTYRYYESTERYDGKSLKLSKLIENTKSKLNASKYFPAKTTINVSESYSKSNGIRICWQSRKKADGYAVYRREKGTKTWKRIKSTVNTSYTDTSVKKGKTYEYRIKVYNKVGTTKVYYSSPSKLIRIQKK